jgi:hypothetical protein
MVSTNTFGNNIFTYEYVSIGIFHAVEYQGVKYASACIDIHSGIVKFYLKYSTSGDPSTTHLLS